MTCPVVTRSTWRVRLVNRACLLPLGTLSVLYLFRGVCCFGLNLYFALWIADMLKICYCLQASIIIKWIFMNRFTAYFIYIATIHDARRSIDVGFQHLFSASRHDNILSQCLLWSPPSGPSQVPCHS